MLRDADNDVDRMTLYPNLDYKGLFNAISQLVDSASHLQYGIQGKIIFYMQLQHTAMLVVPRRRDVEMVIGI